MRKRWLLMWVAAMLTIMTLLYPSGMLAEGGLNGALTSTRSPEITATAASTPEPVDATAQAAASPAPTSSPSPTPSPTPTPAPVRFEGDGLKLTLPEGFALIEGEALEGFEAALEDDYPGTARTLFAARDAGKSAAVVAITVEAEVDCLDAAREAADALIDDAQAASEARFGENRCASFACAIGEQGYYLYFFSDGARLLIIGASGLEVSRSEAMLAGLEFGETAASPEATPADTPPASPDIRPSATSE